MYKRQLRNRGAEVVEGCTMRTLDLSDDPRLLADAYEKVMAGA